MGFIARRQYKRQKTELLASVYTQHETIPATITDMGNGGFGMVLNQAIPQGSQVTIELPYLGEYVVQGIVVWSSKVREGRHTTYRIGVEAESINWTDLKVAANPTGDDLLGKIIAEAVSP